MINYYIKSFNPQVKGLLLKNKTMKEEITADWARKTSESILGEKIYNQIKTCLDAIERAVKANQMACSINIYADALVVKDLNKRGFKVEQSNDQRDGSYLTISW
jgi:enamine deaminase RidA (YjgF/YER057c/UK114 family)